MNDYLAYAIAPITVLVWACAFSIIKRKRCCTNAKDSVDFMYQMVQDQRKLISVLQAKNADLKAKCEFYRAQIP